MKRWGEALLAFLVSFALFALLLQDVTFGDGIFYLDWARQGRLYAHHHLYLPSMVPFMRALEWIGVADRTACFLFSAFTGALGNAFLYLAVRGHVRDGLHAAAFVLLAATAPVVMFFVTTVENHGPHYMWTCLALWALDVAIERRTLAAFGLAGCSLACVPASHLSGFMLVPAWTLLAWSEAGRRPVFRAWSGSRLARIGVFVLPLAIYVLLFHLTTSFRTGVLRLTPDLLADPIGFEFDSKIFGREQRPAQWVTYLFEAGLLPSFGTGAVFLAGWRRLARAGWIWLPLAGIAPYVVLLPLHGFPERGAYFLALGPWVVFFLARTARDSRALAALCLLAGVAQGVAGVLQILRYPDEAPAASKRWAQQWAADAMRVDAGVQAAHRFYLCEDLWRTTHLTYDQRTGALHLPSSLQQHSGNRRVFLTWLAGMLPRQLAKGPIYVSEELWQALPRLWPELRALLESRYRPARVRAGSFHARRIGEN